MNDSSRKILIVAAAVAAVVALIALGWYWLSREETPEGLFSTNGRIEATEVDIATEMGGRVVKILADEGDFVTAGSVVAQMETAKLEAQQREAQAQLQQARQQVQTAQAQVAMRRSDLVAAEATLAQRQSELEAALRRLRRSEALAKDDALSIQELDNDRTNAANARAAVNAAKAQVAAAKAAIEAGEAGVTGAQSAVVAAQASVERIESDLHDRALKAPLDGRVQYRLAEPGEVLGEGDKVLNLIDLADVYMSFFLPTDVVGRVALDDEVRIVLDAMPDWPIPARITFVASEAQFTPKMVETAEERQKLMFRVRATIDPQLLREYRQYVKPGLPGVVWVRSAPQAEWPQQLQLKWPQALHPGNCDER